ncbi:MAG: NFACT family protein [Christensenellales bacterium]
MDRQKPYPTVSQALERYFGARDQQDRINQKSASMVKLLKGQIERCEKKLAQQEEDLSSAARMDEYRIMGEIINANLWQLKKGQTEATLPNFYDENGGSMTIPMDNQLTPVQNAQRYFKKYQRRGRRGRLPPSRRKRRSRSWIIWKAAAGRARIGESELEEIRRI